MNIVEKIPVGMDFSDAFDIAKEEAGKSDDGIAMFEFDGHNVKVTKDSNYWDIRRLFHITEF